MGRGQASGGPEKGEATFKMVPERRQAKKQKRVIWFHIIHFFFFHAYNSVFSKCFDKKK